MPESNLFFIGVHRVLGIRTIRENNGCRLFAVFKLVAICRVLLACFLLIIFTHIVLGRLGSRHVYHFGAWCR
jgi:hypothetical protein